MNTDLILMVGTISAFFVLMMGVYSLWRTAKLAVDFTERMEALESIGRRLSLLETDFSDRFESFAKRMDARTQKRAKSEPQDLNKPNGGIIANGPPLQY